MAGEIEAVGDVLTGAAIASAVEPVAGEGGVKGQQLCLNCQTPLTGAYCSNCGQKSHVHRTLRGFGHDILHGVLHFDGKIWRTLPMLAWNPGKLTRRYVHGERAKFVSPIALFLFMVFLSFAVFSWMAPSTGSTEFNVSGLTTDTVKEVADKRAEVVADIKKLEAEKAQALSEKQPAGWMDGELARHRETLKRIDDEEAPAARKRETAIQEFKAEQEKLETEIAQTEAKLAAAKKAGQPTKALEEDLSGKRIGLTAMKAAAKLAAGEGEQKDWTFTDSSFFGSEKLNQLAQNAGKNPQLLLFKIQSNAYKFSWALIPISVPLVWLLFFWRRKFKMFDHAVFVTYSLCFMMALGVLSAIILSQTEDGSFVFVVAILVLIFLPPIHIYRQLHHAYETSRFGALWRTFLLSNFALLALGLFSALILTLGITS